MKIINSYILLLLLLISCKQKISDNDISKINGYWEIEKVILSDGNKKDYSINQSYDYFKVENNKGIRKKVMPQLDGTFLVNDDAQKIEIIFKDEKCFLKSETEFDNWKDEIIELTDEKLILKNSQNVEYQYKKTAPINLLGNGKENK